MSYLDNTGLAYFWQKIKDYVDAQIAGSGVSGVKGDAETDYRTGQVNLTPANIGAAATGHTHALSEITDQTASTSMTLSNLGSGTKTLYLQRFGPIVVAQMQNVTSVAANTAISAGTIPSGYRPNHNVYMAGPCVSNNTETGTYRWTISTAGAITFIRTQGTGTYETPLSAVWYTTNAWPS